MSLLEFLRSLRVVAVPLYVAAVVVPLGLWAVGAFWRAARVSRGYGHVASALVAVGLLVMVFATLVFAYLSHRGTDLLADIPALTLLAPFVFGVGTAFAATRIVPFRLLRTFPLLRRVWATLLLAALVIAAGLVLEHTYWLIFSGIIGFLVVALIVWLAARRLWRRASR